MVDFVADALWPSVALMAVVLPLLGLAGVLRATLRQNHRFRAVLRVLGVVLVFQLILIPIYVVSVIGGDWPPMDQF